MKIFKDIYEWGKYRNSLPSDKSLGVVLTMGALHDGHMSLIERSKHDNDYTLVTIFLNPTQFSNPKDLGNYPKTWDQDVEKLKRINIDFLLAPKYEQIYVDDYRYKVSENEFSSILCGASRAGHFDGALTVVMKLLNIAKADRTYFGEKDYQQYLLVKGMVEAFFMDTEVIPCKTIREEDGLPMSSRNLRLSSEGRKLASLYAAIIRGSMPLNAIRKKLEQNNIAVDYLEEHFNRRFAAVLVEGIRLIDNFECGTESDVSVAAHGNA